MLGSTLKHFDDIIRQVDFFGLKFSFDKTNISKAFQIVSDTQIKSHFVKNVWFRGFLSYFIMVD